MKISLAHRIVTISLIILMYGTNVIPLSTPQSVNQSYEETQKTAFTGQILFAPIDSTKTYLIDSTGMVNHTWSSSYFPGEAVRWLGNGTILSYDKNGVIRFWRRRWRYSEDHMGWNDNLGIFL